MFWIVLVSGRFFLCQTVKFIAIEKPSGSEEEEQEQEEPTAEQEMADAATRPRFVDFGLGQGFRIQGIQAFYPTIPDQPIFDQLDCFVVCSNFPVRKLHCNGIH